jgi:hypothetical protein
MSTELATTAVGVRISTMDDLARVADMFAKSGFFADAREAAQCGVKIMAGAAWGIDPFTAMSGIHIISNKPSVSAGLMAAAVKGHPKYDYRVRARTGVECRIEFFEGAESLGVSEFTVEMAGRAGLLNNPTWKKFPEAMLFARAMSAGVRTFCPDVFTASVYTAEELGAVTDDDGNIIDVPSRVERPVERPALEAPAPEPQPEPAAAPEAPGEPLAGKPQLAAIARELKNEGVGKDDALAFFRWFTKRDIAGAAELTAREATAFLALVANGKFADSLAEFAVDTAGGPPEPDVSDLGAVVEERPIEFDPTGSVSRQAKRGVAS